MPRHQHLARVFADNPVGKGHLGLGERSSRSLDDEHIVKVARREILGINLGDGEHIIRNARINLRILSDTGKIRYYSFFILLEGTSIIDIQ